MDKKKYYLNFALLVISAFLLGFSLHALDNNYVKTDHYWIPIVFFSIATLLVNNFLIDKKSDAKIFLFKSLGVTILRLLLCMIAVLIYSVFYKETQLAFSLHFMLQYVIFTIFELSFIIKHLKNNP